MKNGILFIIGVQAIFLLCSCTGTTSQQVNVRDTEEHPRIVNIINFIRLLEPRDKEITEDVLYQTVVNQIDLMNKYSLRGTFLLQYDALLDARYQKLLKDLPDSTYEIGAWWETPQPLVENAGLEWRGRYPWDWHANVGFSTGYTPEEREKLVDIYMKDFRAIFGYYPKSVGSWYIDAHTLNYMYEKYGIIASCNCRDQIGTDGYTLWGGYWSQAYYPSKKNAYMPAQNEANQIPVPIFRMLGSDPVPQYDTAIGMKRQGNVTLEPVYHYSGGDSAWIYWYMNEFVEGECLDFAYVQVGQENSFTWEKMSKGLKIQLPLVAKLMNDKKVRVETLAESGQWFKERYKTTPATLVTINKDLPGSDRKTVWFDSRFYRANILWENGTMRFTDIHMFDENFESDYLKKKGTSTQFFFYTLPFIDGYTAIKDKIGGLRLKMFLNGAELKPVGMDPEIHDSISGKLHIVWPLKSPEGKFVIDMDENEINMYAEGVKCAWFLELENSDNAVNHYQKVDSVRIDCHFKTVDYSVGLSKGTFSTPGNGIAFRMMPDENRLTITPTYNNHK